MSEKNSPSEIINAIRALAMDAVQKANSGHPGMPMGMAEIATVLWQNHLQHNPANPKWPNRDRFILSNGHGSMLLYSLLHLTGYDLSLDDIKRFRQLHSKTPGHPEYGYTPGVETTTGPLGQGLANAVGMALAEKLLAAEFNRDGWDLINHYTYVFAGDGCLMEGISHEVCSLAGTLGLGKLIIFYDDNNVSIDGLVTGWFTDDTPTRFNAYGWHVIPNIDGHDTEAIDAAIKQAKAVRDKPSLLCCKTVIAKGSPNKAGTADAHGAALGEKEVQATRENIGWSFPPFEIPQLVYEKWDARKQGAMREQAWNEKFAAYQKQFPRKAADLKRRLSGDLPTYWGAQVGALIEKTQNNEEVIATRKASQNVLQNIGPLLPELIGGSADLTGSNLTLWHGSKAVTASSDGNYIYYGVREFGMCAIANGLSLYGGFIPYSGTFLVFSDYARNALRMAALMKLRNIFVFTHDSIGLGEDGPTHQAIEHAASLRIIPNMDVWRPCDTVESTVAWACALERREGPTSLLLSRQNTAFQKRNPMVLPNIRRGGYVLIDVPSKQIRGIILATGSEVELAVEAQQLLSAEDIFVRVVSMPSTTVFDRQDDSYKKSVLIPGLPKIAIEAGSSDFWRKYVGLEGVVIGIDRFGESAPAKDLFKHFGFTVEKVVKAVKSVVK